MPFLNFTILSLPLPVFKKGSWIRQLGLLATLTEASTITKHNLFWGLKAFGSLFAIVFAPLLFHAAAHSGLNQSTGTPCSAA